jgi:hypothetical protein
MADKIDPRWAWAAYRPSAEAPWDVKRAGHLYRRAAFGGTYAQLQAAVKDGPEKTIGALLKGGDGQEAFERSSGEIAQSIAKGNNGQLLRAWWLNRMLYTPHPLREKLTLFWHNHFATSIAKPGITARHMLGQYELMRRHAQGSFAVLLREMSEDPAMLVWLDGKGSKKGNPNENYAREIMELFSIGIGHYTEKDIREAARAFTGWDVVGDEAVYDAGQHDDGDKTVLGHTGNLTGDDVVRICLEQKTTPYFILRKLFKFLVSETVEPTDELLAPLAEDFRNGYDFGAVVAKVLRSNLFFAPAAYRTRIKSPVEFALGIVKGLEGKVGTTTLATALEQLGQSVFNPPNVKGWDGGEAWLNGQTLLYRQNLALALTSTEDVRFGTRLDPAALPAKYGKQGDEEVAVFFMTLFLQDDVPSASRQRLLEYQQKAQKQAVPVYWTAEDAAHHRVRALAHLVLSLPEFQLC